MDEWMFILLYDDIMMMILLLLLLWYMVVWFDDFDKIVYRHIWFINTLIYFSNQLHFIYILHIFLLINKLHNIITNNNNVIIYYYLWCWLVFLLSLCLFVSVDIDDDIDVDIGNDEGEDFIH